jgi:hypothetical protein
MSYSVPIPSESPVFGRVVSSDGVKIDLARGKYLASDSNADFVSASIENLAYGDLTGDKQAEAVLYLHFRTAGTQHRGLLMIYELQGKRLRVLDRFWTGDRANYGLRDVRIAEGRVVVDLFVPEDAQGDCCATRAVQITLEWNGRVFDVSQPTKPFSIK